MEVRRESWNQPDRRENVGGNLGWGLTAREKRILVGYDFGRRRRPPERKKETPAASEKKRGGGKEPCKGEKKKTSIVYHYL